LERLFLPLATFDTTPSNGEVGWNRDIPDLRGL
jgi:hypothetical protein